MTATRIVGGRILTPQGQQDRTVTIVDSTIESITDTYTKPGSDTGPGSGSDPDHDIDAAGLIVSPGFIDLQINGGFGIDLLGDPHAMWELGRLLPRHGVTTFLPTIISSPPEATAAALDALGHRPPCYRGAEPLGAHFEGPMLSPRRPGAHCVDHLVAPGNKVIEPWTRDNGVVLVTIAPELPNAPAVVAELVSRGVTVSAGHSDATADEAKRGFDAGITLVTHLFNAMAPLGHREPNLVGVTLAENGVAAGVIVDGVHVDPVVVAAIWNAKGPAGMVLVTDAVAAMGQGPGHYELAGRSITADDRGVRNADGTLAGSDLTMDLAVRNLVAYTGCDPTHGLAAASTTPARIIGETQRGRIQPGALADLVLLDQDLEVQLTFCAGELVYVADTASDRLPARHREAR